MKGSLHSMLIVLLLFTSCDDDVEETCQGTFYDVPAVTIQKCVEGKWQIHYSLRGCFTPRTRLERSFMTIGGDSITFQFDQHRMKEKFTWRPLTDYNGRQTFAMSVVDYYDEDSHEHYGLQYVLSGLTAGDTLFMSIHGMIGGGYSMTRINSENSSINY